MTDEDGKLEREVSAVLARASRISVPGGAQTRLMAKLPPRAASNVLLFEPRKTRGTQLRSRSWSIGAALAACFAIGIFLGANSSSDVFWPGIGDDDDETIIGLVQPDELFDGEAS